MLTTMTLLLAAAVLAPVIAARIERRLFVPAVVLELLFGVLLGPQVLGWASVDVVVDALHEIGLALLIFMAGYEVDLPAVRGTPLRLATIGWLVSLVLGLGLAALTSGPHMHALVVGLCLTTTALGTLLPIVRDAGLVKTPFGARMMSIGALGEFGPIVAMSLLLTTDRPLWTAVLLAAFAGLVVLAAALARRPRSARLAHLLKASLGTSAQLAVRLTLLIVVSLVTLAASFGLDVLLGAFAAGIVVRLAVTTLDDQLVHAVESKLEAVSFGFFIPIFFVVSGMGIDLRSLADPAALAKMALFVALFFVVRGLPVLVLHRNDLPSAQRRPLALMASAGLPLIVVITGIGAENGSLSTADAASLVAAGTISVLIYPVIAIRQLRKS